MRIIEYFLSVFLGLVVIEATVIIIVNCKFKYWEPINKIHMISLLLYPIYLSSVIYASLECNRSNGYCDMMWKICCTLYIAVTMAVYKFYYVKSKVVHTVDWNGKQKCELLAIALIAMMGVAGLAFFWLPIQGFQYTAFLVDGECRLVERRWIPIVWMLGDTAASVVLLVLFIQPLQEIKKQLGASPKSVSMLFSMKRLTTKNRNILAVIVLVTLIVMVTVAAKDLNMRTVHYLCVMDRLVTLQSITLTFSYEGIDFFYYRGILCFCCTNNEEDNANEVSSSELVPIPTQRTITSPSIIVMSPSIRKSGSGRRESSSICIEFGSGKSGTYSDKY